MDILSADELFWLYLNNREKMNVTRFSDLYFKYGTKNSFINALLKNEISLSEQTKVEIINDQWLKKCYEVIDYMDKKDIYVVFYSSKKYPQRLKYLDNPPAILYYIGDISITEEDCVAVIGSRVSSSYGRKCAQNFSEVFATHEVCVVSGMAEGIDGCAQNAVLDNGGTTIAVLGGGIDYVYPQTNSHLYDRICKKGLVVSEFPLATQPQKGNFPYRNRLIIGLSDCLVVAEAGLPSGTMSTVDYALEQGKNIYAVPGSISSPTSAGTNYLIKNGCLCAVDPYDVLSEFGKFKIDKTNGPIPCDENLDSLQNDILKLLTVEDLSFEQIEEALNVDSEQLNMALTMLEICGYVDKEAGRNYSLNR